MAPQHPVPEFPDQEALRAGLSLSGMPGGDHVIRALADPHVRGLLDLARQGDNVGDGAVSGFAAEETTVIGSVHGRPESDAETATAVYLGLVDDQPAAGPMRGSPAPLTVTAESTAARHSATASAARRPAGTTALRAVHEQRLPSGPGPEPAARNERSHDDRRRRVLRAAAVLTAVVLAAGVTAWGLNRHKHSTSAGNGATAVSEMTVIPDFPLKYDIISPLQSYILRAATDPAIATSYTLEGGDAVNFNAVANSPDAVRAIAAIVLYIGGDPYGFGSSVGVVPELQKEFTQDVTAVNTNLAAAHKPLLKVDPTNPYTGFLAGFHRANMIIAALTKGNEDMSFNELAFFSQYYTELGYQGKVLDDAVDTTYGLYQQWGDTSSEVYKALTALKPYDRDEAAILTALARAGIRS